MEIKPENSRTAMLIGTDGLNKLKNARVAVFGIGGVGGYAAEALARAGVGAIDLFDPDTVALSNINRQIIALHSTVGRAKVEVMKERILDISPECTVNAHQVFYMPDNADTVLLDGYTYIIDAIDTVTAKLELAVRARAAGVPLISSMGTGNKLDPTRLRLSDLSKTSVCPLARVMRRELKARGILHLPVVWSEEPAITPMKEGADTPTDGKQSPGSVSFVPSVAGLMLASRVIRDICKIE